jgi:DNA repair protein RadB
MVLCCTNCCAEVSDLPHEPLSSDVAMTELTELTGVGPASAKELRQQGVSSIEELAQADPDGLSVPTGNIKTLIGRAKQEAIVSDTMTDVLDDYQTQTFSQVGLDGLDDAMGGGWEAGTLGLVYGKSGKGKSQLAFSSMVQAASEGPVVYLQTENQSLSIAERLASMAEDAGVLDNIVRFEAYDIEDQFQTYNKIEQEFDELSLLVIDSFTGQFRVTDRFQGRQNLGERSDAIGQHLRKLGEMARSYNCPIVLTGQVYPEPEAYGQGDKIWGGEKLRHFVSYYVRLSEGQGELKKATLQNHPGRDEQEVQFHIDSDGLSEV